MFGFLAAAALVARGAAKASRGGEVIAPTLQAQNQPFQPFPAQVLIKEYDAFGS